MRAVRRRVTAVCVPVLVPALAPVLLVLLAPGAYAATPTAASGTSSRHLVTYFVVAIAVAVLLLVAGITGLVMTRDVRRRRHR